jgi:hypothetical protein
MVGRVSGSSWRVDRYDYYEEGKHLVLGGEGAAGQMDIFYTGPWLGAIPPMWLWMRKRKKEYFAILLWRCSGLASTWDSFFSMNLSPLLSKNDSSIAPVWFSVCSFGP